ERGEFVFNAVTTASGLAALKVAPKLGDMLELLGGSLDVMDTKLGEQFYKNASQSRDERNRSLNEIISGKRTYAPGGTKAPISSSNNGSGSRPSQPGSNATRSQQIQAYGSLVQSLAALVNALSAYNAAQPSSRRN